MESQLHNDLNQLTRHTQESVDKLALILDKGLIQDYIETKQKNVLSANISN